MCHRLVVALVCTWSVVWVIQAGLITNIHANGRITCTGEIFYSTQPGRSRDEEVPDDTVPLGQWMLSGTWKMEIDPDVLAITMWEHNMVMLRAAEGDNLLPGDERGGSVRDSHTVQLMLRDARLRSLNCATCQGRVTGVMDTHKNGKPQFVGDDVELLFVRGGGFSGMTNLEIRFRTEPDRVTNVVSTPDTGIVPRNAREHFGARILGTIQRVTSAE